MIEGRRDSDEEWEMGGREGRRGGNGTVIERW